MQRVLAHTACIVGYLVEKSIATFRSIYVVFLRLDENIHNVFVVYRYCTISFCNRGNAIVSWRGRPDACGTRTDSRIFLNNICTCTLSGQRTRPSSRPDYFSCKLPHPPFVSPYDDRSSSRR